MLQQRFGKQLTKMQEQMKTFGSLVNSNSERFDDIELTFGESPLNKTIESIKNFFT